MAGNEEWRKNADTHMGKGASAGAQGTVDSSSKRPPPPPAAGGTLHQTRKLPYSLWKMAFGGMAVVGGIYYMTLYIKKKPEADAADVLKVATNTARPEDTRPRK